MFQVLDGTMLREDRSLGCSLFPATCFWSRLMRAADPMQVEDIIHSSLNRQVLFYVGSHLRFGKWTLRCQYFSRSGKAVVVLQHDGQLQVNVLAEIRQ